MSEEKDNVVSLADKSESALHWGVEDMLAYELAAVRSGERQASKAFVIFVDEDPETGQLMIGNGNAGMSTSDIVTILEFVKLTIAQDLGVV